MNPASISVKYYFLIDQISVDTDHYFRHSNFYLLSSIQLLLKHMKYISHLREVLYILRLWKMTTRV